jgi:hypothetical protein
MRKLSYVAVGLALGLMPALAQDAAPTNGPSRYTFNSVKDGFLRLDNANGQVTFCSSTVAGWACQAVPEDRAALEKEIARLQDEVAGLKSEIAALREPSPPRPPADLSPPSGRDDAAQIREDLARAKVAIGNAWQRLVDMVVGFQKDMMHKG